MARRGRKVSTHQLRVDRIRQRLDDLNLFSTEASLQAGMNRTWLQTILDGKTKDATGSAVIELARVLHCDVAYLYGHQDVPRVDPNSPVVPLPSGSVKRVPIIGKVQAGTWIEVNAHFEPSEFIVIDMPDDFPDAEFLIFDVAGDSMDKAGILDGDRMAAWNIFSYPFPVRDGDDVVVERRRADLREWTVKRLFNHPDGMKELRPISSNPAHQSYRILPGEDGPENEIQIVAVVDRVIRQHRRRYGA